MTSRRPWWTSITAAAILTSVALTAGACSDSEPAAGDRTTPSSPTVPSSASTTGGPATTPSTTTGPTGSTGPAETPSTPAPSETGPPVATGPRLSVGPLSLRVPRGWRKPTNLSPFDVSADSGDGIRGNIVQLVTFPIIVGTATPYELARDALKSFGPGSRILDPVVLDGVEMSHVRGEFGGVTTDRYLTSVDGDQLTITFGYDVGIEKDRAAQQELLDQVLPTVQWSR